KPAKEITELMATLAMARASPPVAEAPKAAAPAGQRMANANLHLNKPAATSAPAPARGSDLGGLFGDVSAPSAQSADATAGNDGGGAGGAGNGFRGGGGISYSKPGSGKATSEDPFADVPPLSRDRRSPSKDNTGAIMARAG